MKMYPVVTHEIKTNTLYIHRCRLELFKKSLVPDSIRLWDLLKLKAEAREAISINSFRKRLLLILQNV